MTDFIQGLDPSKLVLFGTVSNIIAACIQLLTAPGFIFRRLAMGRPNL
jgi:hypothetical protein